MNHGRRLKARLKELRYPNLYMRDSIDGPSGKKVKKYGHLTTRASKNEVIEKWGQPDRIIEEGFDDMGLKKEAWVYDAWFPNTPIDYRHLSRRKKILFIGDYVIGLEDIEDKEEHETVQE